MRICVVGAGAIGGMVGVCFAQAGHEVTLVARGRNLDAIAAHGMRLLWSDGRTVEARNIRATASLTQAGPQDLIVLGMKSHQVEAIAPEIARACHAGTIVLPMQNGIPWWYFQRLPDRTANTLLGTLAGRRVAAVDPGGVIAASIDPERIVGCVVYPAAELAEPGVVRHIEGDRFSIGELDGMRSARVENLSAAFEQAGLKAPILDDVRSEIWLKLWGNLTFNPISALTHSTLVDICQFPLARGLATNMMREAQAVAERIGVRFRVPLEKRIAGAERVGKHKTSMLQDIELGRAPEIDALVGAVIELGREVSVPTPCTETVYALVKLLARTLIEDKVFIRAQMVAA
jgi:2-dehydropantoate 2-reductase